jgi:dTDP-4-amino-4,6-dideoxygalactose transaminase
MIPAARPLIGKEERRAVDQVLASGGLAQGREVAAFEQEFSAAAVSGAHCVAVNSGTSAQHLAMLAAGIGPGDEVLVPSFTFAATANSVALTGARPVFVDIDADTFCMSVAAARDAITNRTRAIMPVHLYGHPADLPGLLGLREEFDLVLIEDAAQAHLASLDDRPVGTWDLAGSFSFYPTKNMTSGEGGMVSTNDADLARTVRLLRNQGQERKYHNEIVGFNNRMTDIHAAIGRVQLTKLADWTAKRQANAAFFDRSLRGVVTPTVAPGAVHVYHQYTIRVVGLDRDIFAAQLAERGVGSGVYYPVPNHRLPAFAGDLNLPETERAAREVLSLPVYPSLTESELVHIVESVNSVASAGVGSG